MSFTGIVVVLLSPVLFLATRGKDVGAFMNEEMMCCCNEDIAVELLAVAAVVIASQPAVQWRHRQQHQHHLDYIPGGKQVPPPNVLASLQKDLAQSDDGLPDRLQLVQRQHPRGLPVQTNQKSPRRTISDGPRRRLAVAPTWQLLG